MQAAFIYDCTPNLVLMCALEASRSTGKERDSESGNDYFGARYYASSMGRMLSPDPGNAGADPTNPQSWNMYSYVLNNPLIYTDPSGEECVWDDGSFDSADDKQTGSAGGCSGQGGTWVNPVLFENAMLTNGQWNSNYGDWSGQANSNLAQNWVSPAVTSDATPQDSMTVDATGIHFNFDPNFNYSDPSVTGAQVSAFQPKQRRKLSKQEISELCGLAGELSAGGTNPGGGLSNQDPSEDTPAQEMDLPTKATFKGGQYAGHEFEVREIAPGGRAVDPLAGVLSAIGTRNYCVYYATQANH
jgi:RHS repeat-associated protein